MSSDLPFIDPTRGGSKTQLARARRPMNLAGMTVGLLDNTKEQADVILETIGKALREKYGVAEVVMRRKNYYSRPAPAELINDMANKVQMAIAAVGG